MPPAATPETINSAIELEALSLSYVDQTALDGLTLNVPMGSVFGLLGPNGSGKSTLFSVLAGLRTADAGSVSVLGETPSPPLRSRMGFLLQASSLDPLMTVRETFSLHGRLYTMRGGSLRRRIDSILRVVGLADRADDLVRTLSGGMKRRLELGRAILPSPELLLLDEPTTGLDPDSQQALWAHLLEINAEGATVVVATNNVGEADTHCHTVAFIHRGRIVAQGSPSQLKTGLKRDGVWVEGEFNDDLIQQVSSWPEVGKLTFGASILHATVDSAAAFVPRLFEAAGDSITSIRLREATLEDAYFDIVGAPLSVGGDTS